METKVIISDPKSGSSFNKVLTQEEMENFIGKKLGEKINLSIISLDGYEGIISGGSYMTGTPMRNDIDGIGLKKVLTGQSAGNKSKVRLRKSIAGNTISQFTSQINIKITGYGEKPLAEVLSKKANG